MKRIVLSVAVALGLASVQVNAQDVEGVAPARNDKGVVGRIVDDFKESVRTTHQINKENFAAEKENARKNNPEFVEFWQAKGFKNKCAVVANDFRDGLNKFSEKEKERREQIKSHDNYRSLLEEQRAKTEALINKG